MRDTKQATSTHQVFSHTDFYEAFQRDIESAKALVIIHSPFIADRRIAILEPLLNACVRRRVRVCVFLQKPRYSDQDAVAKLQSLREFQFRLTALGIHVNLRERIHEKLAIIDDKILWEGSLNILSQNQSSERMNRWTNQTMLREAVIKHNLDSCGDCRKRGSIKQFSRYTEGDFEHRRIVADITKRRIERGLSQKELALLVGISPSTVCHFESGKYDIRLWTLIKICESLDFKMKALPWHYVPAVNDILESHSED